MVNKMSWCLDVLKENKTSVLYYSCNGFIVSVYSFRNIVDEFYKYCKDEKIKLRDKFNPDEIINFLSDNDLIEFTDEERELFIKEFDITNKEFSDIGLDCYNKRK